MVRAAGVRNSRSVSECRDSVETALCCESADRAKIRKTAVCVYGENADRADPGIQTVQEFAISADGHIYIGASSGIHRLHCVSQGCECSVAVDRETGDVSSSGVVCV